MPIKSTLLCQRQDFSDVCHKDSSLELEFRVLVRLFALVFILFVFLVFLHSHELVFRFVWIHLFTAEEDTLEEIYGVLFPILH